MTPEEEKLYAELASEYFECERKINILNRRMNDIARRAIKLSANKEE